MTGNFINSKEIQQIFESVKTYAKTQNKEWDVSTIETFILSFERNTQEANELFAKKYGNIIKNLVKEIMVRDFVILPDDTRNEKELLSYIFNDNKLHSMFNKLYTLVKKFEEKKS